MAADNNNGYEIEEMEIQLEDGGSLGVSLGLDLGVTEIAEGSPLSGRINVGDRIITVSFPFRSSFSLIDLDQQRIGGKCNGIGFSRG